MTDPGRSRLKPTPGLPGEREEAAYQGSFLRSQGDSSACSPRGPRRGHHARPDEALGRDCSRCVMQRLTRRVSLHFSAAVSGEMWLGLPQLTAARSLAAWDPPREGGAAPFLVREMGQWQDRPPKVAGRTARRVGHLARPGTHVREGCR